MIIKQEKFPQMTKRNDLFSKRLLFFMYLALLGSRDTAEYKKGGH